MFGLMSFVLSNPTVTPSLFSFTAECNAVLFLSSIELTSKFSSEKKEMKALNVNSLEDSN
jgi:hypothetical protein